MNLNIDNFIKNKKLLVIMLIAVVFLAIIKVWLFNDEVVKLSEMDLPIVGVENYSKLVINEIMSSNKGAFSSNEGVISDWIELYNGNNHEINLKGYGLSDVDNKIKWVFPEVTIQPQSYLIVYLSGLDRNGLYANFKLKSSGAEKLFLINSKGKTIDAVNVGVLNSNEVMSRDLEGNWHKSKKITPGFSNTEEGYQKYLSSLYCEDDIIINEFLPRNSGNFKNSDGIYSGYIEIKNTSSKAKDISGYCISNDLKVPFKYCISDTTLNPGEVYLIYTDSFNDSEDNIYSGFKLKSKDGIAILTNNKGKIVSKVEYNNLTNGVGYIYNKNSYFTSASISPGFSNDENGREKFQEKLLKTPTDVIISEVMNNNSSYLPNNGNQYYDWIEIKNNSKSNVNLKDYYVTNTIDDLHKYNLPNITLKPGEFYVIMASGDVGLSNNSYKHANFKISESESLYIIKDSKIIDSIFVSDVPIGYSIGKDSSYGVYYYKTPTPLKNNSSGVASIAYTPRINIDSGVYNDINSLNIEIEGNGTLYYTLDGSKPTLNSNVYKGPISINSTTVIRVINYEPNKIISEEVFGSYIVNENHTLPVMSVAMNPSDFNKVQRETWNKTLEVAATAELYDGDKKFKIPCGFKLFGGSTRSLPKKSFSLKFRKKYGNGSLNYQVFENRDYSSYDTLILRSGSQDQESAFFRDILMTSLVDGVANLNVQAYKSVILYINGKYWGVYNIREKVDDNFIANNYNIDKEGTSIVRIDNNITVGDPSKYFNLLSYLNTHDMRIKSNYEYVKTVLNIESYADFWIAENWVTNNDIVNARFYWNPNIDSGRINMIFYDLDCAMWFPQNNYFTFSTSPDGMSRLNISTQMMRNLIVNEEFQKTLLSRMKYQLENVWNEERVIKRIDEIYEKLKPEMKRNQIRWGMTYKHWEECVEHLRKFARARKNYMLKNAKSYFSLSDKEMKEIFGDLYE